MQETPQWKEELVGSGEYLATLTDLTTPYSPVHPAGHIVGRQRQGIVRWFGGLSPGTKYWIRLALRTGVDEQTVKYSSMIPILTPKGNPIIKTHNWALSCI